MLLTSTLIDWSRMQFAMTAMYHWLFVPLTLGMGIVMALAETKYYRTGDDFWKEAAKFWQKVFGINFAAGIATGLILEFQFGTNWSNYSYFVGDIFGAPLAIEGMFAFFMEATFFAIMFFGWGKVSKKFHLTATWLTIFGATMSAWWILVANAWMQYPQGMVFNPDTVRHEMVSFVDVAFSPVAVVKFFHSVISSWILGSIVVMGISAYYLLRKKNQRFAIESIRLAAWLGLISSVITAFTGHLSAGQVASHQPMKLAAMENMYVGRAEAPLSAFGIVNPDKKKSDWASDKPDYLAGLNIELPYGLSILSYNDPSAFVPGIKDILEGYTAYDGTVVLPASERIERGKMAIQALADYRAAKEIGNEAEAEIQRGILDANMEHFGYGYMSSVEELIPNVPMLYYSFRAMVGLGMLFILICLLPIFFIKKDREKFADMRWYSWVLILSVPLVYIASQCGWVVAEVGRQPWTIQNALPVQAAVSNIAAGAVKTTFILFLVLFSVMLIAELSIMLNAIKKGPNTEAENITNVEQ
ncbi:Cytochrome bd ubiquinol oxidase subunit 1 [Porphyromonas levii]|uniref:cytochrome ubiquinol oxidase subunit I n=1 Tax=Porphyromonas levii TaxID=28114 RepID=UPI001B8CF549|nr:cytochrome ubiquinol oxidase subunit I [Porphyromonas levii]MBR8731162.1 Cytochrome bd ubiquinol oxidase subunit 1 [Porphyromonas levii]MBR8763838.1 Cytochrome bd ubiquinol oxidase subunit 1 [Porphyromonas levii]